MQVFEIKSKFDGSIGFMERWSKLERRVFRPANGGGYEWTTPKAFDDDGERARWYFTSAVKSIDVVEA